jgi:hypothetical protein
MWKSSERAKKRRRKTEEEAGDMAEEDNDSSDEEWDEEALDALFNETVRFSVINSYVSAITELYTWQSEGKATLSLRGAKLSTLLESARRDEDRIRRVNFIDWGLFTIASGYDVKGLKRAVTWCWETASKVPGSVESYL